MHIEKHFLLNLKRRPERLYAWLGAQDQMKFDFKKLTVFQAIDGKAFKNSQAITEYGADMGLGYLPERHNFDPNLASRGIVAGTVSALVMLKNVSESGSDRYTVFWEDDAVLRIPYKAFAGLSVPRDANIVVFDHHFAHTSPDVSIQAEDTSKIHARLPFYQGVVGAGFLRCYAVNAEGAEQLLALHREKWDEHFAMEGLVVRNSNLPNLYTYIPKIIRLTGISGVTSDIFTDKNKPVKWKTTSAEDLYGKS